jgi:hypothetical protein
MLVLHLAGRIIPQLDALHPFPEPSLILGLFVPLTRFIITKVLETGARRLPIGSKLEICLPSGDFFSPVYVWVH